MSSSYRCIKTILSFTHDAIVMLYFIYFFLFFIFLIKHDVLKLNLFHFHLSSIISINFN